MSIEFDDVLDEFIAGTLRSSPVLASSMGVTEYDHLLDDRSEEGREQDWAFVDSWIARLSAIPPSQLTSEQGLDRDLVMAALGRRRILRATNTLAATPTTYLVPGLNGVSVLFDLRLRSEDELVDAALERMAAIPRLLDNGMRLLDPARTSALAVDRAIRLAQSAAHYFRTALMREVESPESAARLAEACRTVAAAHDRFAAFLTGLSRTASGHWALGREVYSALLREGDLVEHDVDELLTIGQEAFRKTSDGLQRATARLGAAAQRDREAAKPFASLDERMAYLEERVEAARAFVRSEHLLTLPEGEHCAVSPVPEHKRVLTAAASYRRPPPFGTSTVGVFRWPGPPVGASGEVLHGKPLGADTIVAHEVYPGHHAHDVRARDNKRRVRQLHGSSFLTEGWGVYAERLMHSQGFFDRPLEELSHRRALRLRAARIVLDVGLHTGGLDVPEAVALMHDEMGYPAATSQLEVERYCSNPVQAASYYTGLVAVEELRAAFLARGGTILEFHDQLTAIGSLPPALARRALSTQKL